jgi:hypothetical protein
LARITDSYPTRVHGSASKIQQRQRRSVASRISRSEHFPRPAAFCTIATTILLGPPAQRLTPPISDNTTRTLRTAQRWASLCFKQGSLPEYTQASLLLLQHWCVDPAVCIQMSG